MFHRFVRALALAAALTAPTVHAFQGNDRLATAQAAAKANAATAEGRKYEDTIGQAFGRDHAATVATCATTTRQPDLRNFALFIRLDGGGLVDEALATPVTNISQCVAAKLARWKAPAPPRAGWAQVNVTLKPKAR